MPGSELAGDTGGGSHVDTRRTAEEETLFAQQPIDASHRFLVLNETGIVDGRALKIGSDAAGADALGDRAIAYHLQRAGTDVTVECAAARTQLATLLGDCTSFAAHKRWVSPCVRSRSCLRCVMLASTGLIYPVWAMVAMAASVTAIFIDSLWQRLTLFFDTVLSVKD